VRTVGINLSRNPFRSDRGIWAGTFIVSAMLLIGLGTMLYLILAERDQVADLRDVNERLRLQLTRLSRDETGTRASLQRKENATLFERSVFLNSLLLPKSMSWTRLFGDLEATIPFNVKILSVRQQITGDAAIALDMVIATENPESVIAMLKRMENSAYFSQTKVSSIAPPSQNDNTYKYRLTVMYDQKL
jgi:Tfp pilus assembly protein PilN